VGSLSALAAEWSGPELSCSMPPIFIIVAQELFTLEWPVHVVDTGGTRDFLCREHEAVSANGNSYRLLRALNLTGTIGDRVYR
jgi:hypothetical protein